MPTRTLRDILFWFCRLANQMSCRRQIFQCSRQQSFLISSRRIAFQDTKNSLLGLCLQIPKFSVDGISQQTKTESEDIRNLNCSGYTNYSILYDSSSQNLSAEISTMLICVEENILNLLTMLENPWEVM